MTKDQNTFQKYPFKRQLMKMLHPDSDWSEGSRIWGEPGVVGESTLGASFHQAWQVVISGKKEMFRNVPIKLNENQPRICGRVWGQVLRAAAGICRPLFLFQQHRPVSQLSSTLQRWSLSYFHSLESLPKTGACVILIGPVDGELNGCLVKR